MIGCQPQDLGDEPIRVDVHCRTDLVRADEAAAVVNEQCSDRIRLFGEAGVFEKPDDLVEAAQLGPLQPGMVRGLRIRRRCLGKRADCRIMDSHDVEDGVLRPPPKEYTVDQVVEPARTECGQNGFQSRSSPNFLILTRWQWTPNAVVMSIGQAQN